MKQAETGSWRLSAFREVSRSFGGVSHTLVAQAWSKRGSRPGATRRKPRGLESRLPNLPGPNADLESFDECLRIAVAQDIDREPARSRRRVTRARPKWRQAESEPGPLVKEMRGLFGKVEGLGVFLESLHQ